MEKKEIEVNEAQVESAINEVVTNNAWNQY